MVAAAGTSDQLGLELPRVLEPAGDAVIRTRVMDVKRLPAAGAQSAVEMRLPVTPTSNEVCASESSAIPVRPRSFCVGCRDRSRSTKRPAWIWTR
jgi:hypothetical protein